jgi:N-acetylneuraminic acid mutarotase
MIVWGGLNSGYLNDGGRYNPTANTWTTLPTTGAPAARGQHTAVWTGSEMIIWGGYNWISSTFFNDGGRYNPVADSWTALPTTGAPRGRYGNAAVWTVSEMIVWGGYYSTSSDHYLNDGGRYNPTANSWTPVQTNGVPAAREYHTAVWTGSEMIVWGGYYASAGDHYLNDGGRYNPVADGWIPLQPSRAPAARTEHTAVWTGSEMIIWGGGYFGSSSVVSFNDGGRYNLAANSWTALPTAGAPTARQDQTAVWTGSEMIVWGGWDFFSYSFNDGGRYNPVNNNWTAVPTNSAPAARHWHTTVWTGSEMIVWGGYNGGIGSDTYFSDGGRYNPVANSWTALPTTGAPAGRNLHTAVWTGSEMIVWGGVASGSTYFNDGGRYNPVTDSWTTLPTTGAPAGRSLHTAVWTGSEMIVWGGSSWNGSVTSYLNDGGRYSPAGNNWAAMPIAGAPAGRQTFTAVWTGSEMIVFGGYGSGGYLSDPWSYYPYAPAVRISRSSPTSAGVAWPVWSSTLRLCQTTNLAAGQWTTVTNAATQVGLENHVTVSPLSGGQFFRAEYP